MSIIRRAMEGALLGGTLGAALDGLVVVGSAFLGPAALAAATTAVISKTAAGTLIGAGMGAAEGYREERNGSDNDNDIDE